MIKIDNSIFYLEKIENPLSSEVFFIQDDKNTFIFDVGNSMLAKNMIEKYPNASIIISHFHNDHAENLRTISLKNIYVDQATYSHYHLGKIINNNIIVDENEIIPLSSSHSKYSLSFNFHHQYLFIGDALYPEIKNGEQRYNVQKLNELIAQLKLIKTEYIVFSHIKNKIINKETTIESLEKIYSLRKKNSAYIYFNPFSLWK